MNKIESINEFRKNWLEKHPEEHGLFAHNIYHIFTEDMDGNVVDEKFGINCMTDAGFNVVYRQDGSTNPYIYIGSGTSIPTPNSNTMESAISSDPATADGYWEMAFITQRYDSTTGVTTATFRAKSGYFNYTVFSEDKNITEVGIGKAVNNLAFHARVYDASGNPSTIVKHVNERLWITIYLTTSSKVKKIVEDAWSNGVYKLISPNRLSWPGPSWSGNNNGVRCQMIPNHNSNSYDTSIGNLADGSGTISNRIYTRTIQNFGNCLIENQYRYIDAITISNGSNGYIGDYILMFKPKLSTYLELTVDIQLGPSKDDMFYIFGWPGNHDESSYGAIPATDGDIQSMNMYNFITHDWDIPVSFTNPTTADYSAYWLQHSITYPAYFENDGTDKTYRVYLNPYTQYPITKFENHGVPIYATDEYWDPSTLELITDPSNVSQTLGTKKFYCTFVNALPNCDSSDMRYGHGYNNASSDNGRFTIYVERDMSIHTITTQSSDSSTTYGEMTSVQFPNTNITGKMVSDDTYGYVAVSGMLIYPESVDPNATGGTGASASLPYKYTLYGHDGTSRPADECIWNTSAGNKLVVASNSRAGVRVYDVNGTPSVAPTSTAYTFPTAFSSVPAVTASYDGWFAFSYRTGANNVGKTYVLSAGVDNVADDMYEVSGYDTAFIIDLTDYMCCHKSDINDHLSFDIYDMRNKSVVSTFDLDPKYTFLSAGCGFKDYVYLRLYDNTTSSAVVCLHYISADRNVILSSDWQFLCTAFTDTLDERCVLCIPPKAIDGDAIMAVMGTNKSGTSRHFVIKESSPENPIRVESINSDSNYTVRSWFGHVFKNMAQLKYVGNQLLLLVISATYDNYYGSYRDNRGPMVYNIGHICDNGPMTKCACADYTSIRSDFQTGCLYKNSVFRMKPQEYQGSGADRKYYSWYRMQPIERYVPIRTVVRTNTINAYNNPVKVSNVRSFTYQVSNDTSIYEPPV